MFIVAIYKLHKHANIRFHCIDKKNIKIQHRFPGFQIKKEKNGVKLSVPLISRRRRFCYNAINGKQRDS